MFYLLFLYGTLILHCFSLDNTIFVLNNTVYRRLDKYYLTVTSIISNISILIIYATYFCNYNYKNTFYKETSSNPNNSKLIFAIYIVISILAFIKFVIEIFYVSNIGYIEIFVNGFKDVNYYSPLIKYSHNLLVVIYGYILFKRPSRKRFIITSIIYSILSLTSSLVGSRILFVLPLFFTLWYYFRFYSKPKLSSQIKLGIIIFSTIMIFVMALKIKRASNKFDVNELLISVGINQVLSETGSTFQIVSSYLEVKEEVEADYPYVLEPILYPFFYMLYKDIMTSGQSYKLLKTRNALSHRLTYRLSAKSYLAGRGVGSSMVAEMYQYGLIYLILISFIFGYFVSFFEKNSQPGSMILLLSPFLFPSIIFAGRDTPFPNTWGLLKFLMIYFILRILISIFVLIFSKMSLKTSIVVRDI